MGILDTLLSSGGSGLFGNAFDWRTMAGVPNMGPQTNPIAGFGQQAYGQGGAPMPAPQEQMPQQPMSLAPQQQPENGFGKHLSAAFNNIGAAPTLGGALFGGLGGLLTGQSNDNSGLIERALVSKGIDPMIARAAAQNPTLLSAVAGQAFKSQQPTDDIREFEYAKGQGFQGTLEQWMARKRGGAGEYGLQPVWGTDKDGKPVILQLGKSGDAVASRVPEGVSISTGVDKIDLGTRWGLLDKRSGQIIGYEPKDIAGKKVAEATGEAQGAAKVALPKVVDATRESLRLVEELIKHPGRETATGLSSQLDPRNYFAGTDAKSFLSRQKQVQGRTFLEAFQSLKGGGAITEIEGSKAEAAIARLDTSQSDEEYLTALNDLKDVLKVGLSRAEKMAIGDFTATPPPAAPVQSAPATTDLKKKYGLD
jgi:hypothetical protein